MSETKARLIGAITVMNESDAQRLWKLIERLYDTGDWDSIEETEPDEIDLQMIHEAQSDPDCNEFASDAEVRAVFG